MKENDRIIVWTGKGTGLPSSRKETWIDLPKDFSTIHSNRFFSSRNINSVPTVVTEH